MVRACQQRYPDVDVREGDARALTDVADESFDIAIFSTNGIDAVSHEDRALILAEAHRVLSPGGIFLLSTYYLDGPSVRERRWNMPGLNWPDPRRTLARIKHRVVTLPEGLRNYRRLDQAYPGGDGWQMHINGSHEFRHRGPPHHPDRGDRRARGGRVRRGASLVRQRRRRPQPGYFTRPVWYFRFMCVKQG
jgi:SAM-dependent methyltransferase